MHRIGNHKEEDRTNSCADNLLTAARPTSSGRAGVTDERDAPALHRSPTCCPGGWRWRRCMGIRKVASCRALPPPAAPAAAGRMRTAGGAPEVRGDSCTCQGWGIRGMKVNNKQLFPSQNVPGMESRVPQPGGQTIGKAPKSGQPGSSAGASPTEMHTLWYARKTAPTLTAER